MNHFTYLVGDYNSKIRLKLIPYKIKSIRVKNTILKENGKFNGRLF